MTKTITVDEATKALDGWDGMLEVTVQKIGAAGITGYSFDDIEEAVAEYNESIRENSRNLYGGYMVTLAKTWPEDSNNEDTSWKNEVVFLELV